MPVEQLSGVTVVIIIAVCVECFILLFIFAKRQITRFALRNKRGPHTHVGHGAPKCLRKETDKRLDYVPYIKHEPSSSFSLNDDDDDDNDDENPLKYRLLTAYRYNLFEKELARLHPAYVRLPGTDARAFLVKCQTRTVQGPLRDVSAKDVHLLCDLYSHARHHFEPYGYPQFTAFKIVLDRLWKSINDVKNDVRLETAAKELNNIDNNSTLKERRGLDNSGFADFSNAFNNKETSTVLLINNDDKRCSSTAV